MVYTRLPDPGTEKDLRSEKEILKGELQVRIQFVDFFALVIPLHGRGMLGL